MHHELMLDGNFRQNLVSFCRTWVDSEIHELMDECVNKNMIDKDEYPQTDEGKPTDNPNLVTGPAQVCWHKFGLVPLGVGWIVWREKGDLDENLIMPPHREDLVVMCILVRHGFNLDYFAKNPVTVPLTESKSGGV